MKNSIFIVFVIIAVLAFSTITFAQGAEPTGPNAAIGQQQPGMGQPPGAGANTQPLKERLQVMYDDIDSYIHQKKQCKEESMMTNAPSGTCWNKLKPVMIGLLQKEIKITENRLMQLKEKNITFSNIDEINAQLSQAAAVLADSSSSKELIKSTAKGLEDLINEIEDEATKTHPKLLIAQMDNLMAKADSATTKLESKLIKYKAAGIDTSQLESDLIQFKADLEAAKVKIADAKAKYSETGSAEEIAQMAKEIRTLINDAKKNLQKAFDKAKAMILSMNSQSQGNNQQQGVTP